MKHMGSTKLMNVVIDTDKVSCISAPYPHKHIFKPPSPISIFVHQKSITT